MRNLSETNTLGGTLLVLNSDAGFCIMVSTGIYSFNYN